MASCVGSPGEPGFRAWGSKPSFGVGGWRQAGAQGVVDAWAWVLELTATGHRGAPRVSAGRLTKAKSLLEALQKEPSPTLGRLSCPRSTLEGCFLP